MKKRPLIAPLVLALCGVLASTNSTAQMTISGNMVIDQGVGQTETGDGFGEALATGDFDGDGYDDLAVGAPNEGFGITANTGAVIIYRGSTNGLSTGWSQFLWQLNIDDPTCGGSETGDLFGFALASGDFNNDGYDDLAVGSPEENIESPAVSEAGMVQIIMGSATGLDIANATCLYQLTGFLLPGSAGAQEWVGRALTVGNFDADNFDDLAIGAPFDGTGGSVTVIEGAMGGLDIANAEVWTQDTTGMLGAEEAGDAFGSALATGDLFLDGPTACDLVVGVPGEDISEGVVQVIYGCNGGLNASGNQIWRLGAGGVPGSPEIIDSMGAALAVGNFNCTEGADVAAGIPFKNNDGVSNAGGLVVLYSGGFGGLVSAGSEFFDANRIGAPEANEFFGSALAAGPVDGQCDDLFIGAPNAERPNVNTNHGILRMMKGNPGTGIDTEGHDNWDYERFVRPMTTGDHLGTSIAIGRFNGSTPSVAAGVPGYDEAPDTDTGQALIVHSTLIFADGFETSVTSAWSSVN